MSVARKKRVVKEARLPRQPRPVTPPPAVLHAIGFSVEIQELLNRVQSAVSGTISTTAAGDRLRTIEKALQEVYDTTVGMLSDAIEGVNSDELTVYERLSDRREKPLPTGQQLFSAQQQFADHLDIVPGAIVVVDGPIVAQVIQRDGGALILAPIFDGEMRTRTADRFAHNIDPNDTDVIKPPLPIVDVRTGGGK